MDSNVSSLSFMVENVVARHGSSNRALRKKRKRKDGESSKM